MTEAQEVHSIHVNQTSIIIPDLATIQSLLSAVISSQTALRGLIQQQGANMAEDYTALNAALSGLQAEVGTIGTQMDTLLADLNAALATGNQPVIDAATAAIQAQVNALKAAATRDMP